MNRTPRISYWAIAAFALGMAFYVPLISGLLAVATGGYAARIIAQSEGALLGRGLALTGAVLGGTHALFWALILFAGLTYTVDPGESAVVSRSGEPRRVEEMGAHYKIPFLENVTRFPTARVFSYEGTSRPLLFATKTNEKVAYRIMWNVCNPMAMYKGMGRFRQEDIEFRLEMAAQDHLQIAAGLQAGAQQLIRQEDIREQVVAGVQTDVRKLGICIKHLSLNEVPVGK